MAITPITLTGGLDLVTAQTAVRPGRLRACQNFEQTARDGYSKIEGIRAYSGECILGNKDAWVVHGGNATLALDVYNGEAIWGTGQFVDPQTGVVEPYSGKSRVSVRVQRLASNDIVLLNGIQGRFPVVGDLMQFNNTPVDSTATLFSPLVRYSEIADTLTAGIGIDVETLAGAADIADLFCDVRPPTTNDFASSRALPILANPLGYMGGGFYFEDRAHAIVDALTIRFNSGSGIIRPGDKIRIDWTDNNAVNRITYLEVERVTVDSGAWDSNDAAGTISAFLDPSSFDILQWSIPDPSVATINGIENTTGTTIAGFVSYDSAKVAYLFRDTGLSAIGTQGWEKVDLGYELGFTAGASAFTVVDRVNKDSLLETAPTTTTDWKLATAVTSSDWTNPTNILLDDGTGATSQSITPPSPCSPITVTEFGFEIPPNSVITGVEVRIDRAKVGNAATAELTDSTVTLVGVQSAANKAKGDLYPASSAYAKVTYGSDSDVWGAVLTPELVNAAAFGVQLVVQSATGTVTQAIVDAIEVRIHYKNPISKVWLRSTTAPAQAVTSLTSSGTTATITTTNAHGWVTGQTVTIAGASPVAYNGEYAVTVTGATTATYTFAGGTSPATGTITATLRDVSTANVVWYYKKKGAFSTTDAEGVLTLANVSNPTLIQSGMQIRTAALGAGTLLATTSSTCDAVTMAASGALEAAGSQYQTIEANLYASAASNQIFGVSGADYAWSFDGTYFIRIRTGLEAAQDKPRHVAKHLAQLALGFSHGEVILSDAGYPESFAAVFGGSSPSSNAPGFAGGAAAVGVGDAVHGLIPLSEQSLGVFGRNYIQQIVGSGAGTVINMISPTSGIIEYSLKDAGQPVFLDYKGVGTLAATAAYGNFARGRLSRDVSPWLIPRIQETGNRFNSARGFIKAELVRAKNQVRYYFRDRAVLTMTFVDDGGLPSFTTQLYPFTVTSTFSGVDSSGRDHVFLGGYGSQAETNALLSKRRAFRPDGAGLAAASFYQQSILPGQYLYESDIGTTWDDLLPIDGYIEFDLGQHAGLPYSQEIKYDRLLTTGLVYGYAPLGAQFGQDFEDVDTSGTTDATIGSLTADPSRAFSEQTFAIPIYCMRAGKQLRVRFVSSGGTYYDGTTAPTAGFLRFRPVTLQSVLVVDDQQHIKR